MAKTTANATFKVFDNNAVRDAVRKQITKKVKQSYARIESSIRDLVKQEAERQLMSSSVTQSILSGKLRSDFGLSQSAAGNAMKEIIDYVSENIEVSFTSRSRSGAMATLSLNLLPMGVKGLTSLPAGEYTSTGKFGGGDVTWLTWLLTRGTQMVIGDFFVFDEPKGKTRGGSVMVRDKKGKGGFRIDPGFSGTEEDNFVTRALSPIIPKIRNTIFKKIQEGLK